MDNPDFGKKALRCEPPPPYKEFSCCHGHHFNRSESKEKWMDMYVCPHCWPDGFLIGKKNSWGAESAPIDMKCSYCQGDCKCFLRQRTLIERENMEKNTNFSISGGACAPVLPTSNTTTCGPAPGIGCKINAEPIQIRIDKEWIKRLLTEFINDVDENYGGGHIEYSQDEVSEFLEKSEVWNGK